MNNNNSNTFRTSNETLFLVNILNTMYNDNLRQINSVNETLNNLINSNNQIRNLLVQLLNRNQGQTRRNDSRRTNTLNNLSNMNDRNVSYLVGEYTIPLNRNRQNVRQNQNNSTLEPFRNFNSLFESFFQPVEIYPTQTQIETATRRVRYCDISRPVNTSCPISMDDFNDNDMVTVIRHCGHTFHTENIMNWFRTNCSCPVCRYDIRDYNSNVSNQFFNASQDSSNNNVERNNNENSLLNNTFGRVTSSGFFENLLTNAEGIFDASGNYTNNAANIIASMLVNNLNRSPNTS